MRLADDRLLSPAEVARLFGRSTRTLRRWAETRRLTPVRLDGLPFYRASEVERALGIVPECDGE